MRCDACKFWLRDERGQPVYPDNRSQCTMAWAGFGFDCSHPVATATTAAHFWCALFQPREKTDDPADSVDHR
jgi:hypothetical protein